jgi:hypothetical protein
VSKLGSRRTFVDGIPFASKAEAKRYGDLKLLERANEIEGLELQPKYDLIVCGLKVCSYIADFRYRDRRTGETIVEDVKGFRTRDYRIKAKLMKAVHGIEITEIAA